MLARHLTITGKQMEELVIKLSRNEPVPGVADTGAVKPELERNDASSVSEYISFGDGFIDCGILPMKRTHFAWPDGYAATGFLSLR